jgi:hypothetical protein
MGDAYDELRGEMSGFPILTVGMNSNLIRQLWDRISIAGGHDFSHLVHPNYDSRSWGGGARAGDQIYFFTDGIRVPLAKTDATLLSSLETEGGPTIHNMVLSDSIVSKLPYEDALAHATFLALRLEEVFTLAKPAAIIGAFDGLHGSIGYAVAKRLRIPWFAMRFSPLPKAHVALCSDLSPGSVVSLEPGRHKRLGVFAEQLLEDFEKRRVQATAFIPPNLLSARFILRQIPVQVGTFGRMLLRRKQRRFLRYTETAGSHSIRTRVQKGFRLRKNLFFLRRRALLSAPPMCQFAFFGLHMQPESSIDVWSPFFSNQTRVVELLARSLPPTHKLLVKLHKSDVPNYSPAYLEALERFPGVELVSPYADTHELIRKASLVVSIQGTMGLEAALLGKPVIMFGNLLAGLFPSVSIVGKTIDLPALVRAKLTEAAPSRSDILGALARFLEPFYRASTNDWTQVPADSEIDGYVSLFNLLRSHLGDRGLPGATDSVDGSGPSVGDKWYGRLPVRG